MNNGQISFLFSFKLDVLMYNVPIKLKGGY